MFDVFAAHERAEVVPSRSNVVVVRPKVEGVGTVVKKSLVIKNCGKKGDS